MAGDGDMAEEQTRDEEIKAIHKKYAWFYRVLRGAVLIGIGVSVGLLIYATPQAREAYMVNVFTSALGLGATALIFDELNRKRSQDDLKRQLVDDAASTSNAIAKNAVHQLRRKGWLEGENGLLKGANLIEANLNGANLDEANLKGSRLRYAYLTRGRLIHADLSGADLVGAHMQQAKLVNANLRQAMLTVADLREAHMDGANLQGAGLNGVHLGAANLWLTELQGANLHEAILVGAKIGNARFDETTVLPDRSRWTRKTDMRRFTDPAHPNFWQAPSFVGD